MKDSTSILDRYAQFDDLADRLGRLTTADLRVLTPFAQALVDVAGNLAVSTTLLAVQDFLDDEAAFEDFIEALRDGVALHEEMAS